MGYATSSSWAHAPKTVKTPPNIAINSHIYNYTWNHPRHTNSHLS
uniref:NADH dehydrogenase subunit 2 n=1 Tax=Diporiphora bilineata TaxID=118204 RepID=Q9G665_DIPBL|nr:NADH dehydrogenase subunit 2 [Diporiphora bilineata]